MIKISFNRLAITGFCAALLATPGLVKAQDAFSAYPALFTTPYNYVVKHITQAPVIDGDINDAVWQQAAWTPDFQDIEGDLKPKPSLQTNVKLLWDDSCLYVAARMYDPQVWATYTHHDDPLFKENDFEVFIDPANTTHKYYELEINPLNNIFDLFLTKPYRNDGAAISGWDAHGMRTAVKVQGTVNNTSDTDKGWTVEMAIPFKALSGFGKGLPKAGTLWRVNFLRVEYDAKVQNGRNVKLKDTAGHDMPEHNWSWSSQGLINMHYPERWGYLLFSDHRADDVTFTMPYSELQKKYLWLVYYQQKAWFNSHHQYAASLSDLGINSTATITGNENNLKLDAAAGQFTASIIDGKSGTTFTINQDGLVVQVSPKLK